MGRMYIVRILTLPLVQRNATLFLCVNLHVSVSIRFRSGTFVCDVLSVAKKKRFLFIRKQKATFSLSLIHEGDMDVPGEPNVPDVPDVQRLQVWRAHLRCPARFALLCRTSSPPSEAVLAHLHSSLNLRERRTWMNYSVIIHIFPCLGLLPQRVRAGVQRGHLSIETETIPLNTQTHCSQHSRQSPSRLSPEVVGLRERHLGGSERLPLLAPHDLEHRAGLLVLGLHVPVRPRGRAAGVEGHRTRKLAAVWC